MSRDGFGIYSKPAGTTAVSGTTIDSAKYNATIDDIVSDLNAARPITAGGTGATDAATARTNIGVTTALATKLDKAGGEVTGAITRDGVEYARLANVDFRAPPEDVTTGSTTGVVVSWLPVITSAMSGSTLFIDIRTYLIGVRPDAGAVGGGLGIQYRSAAGEWEDTGIKCYYLYQSALTGSWVYSLDIGRLGDVHRNSAGNWQLRTILNVSAAASGSTIRSAGTRIRTQEINA
jgi:hypothetical protein